MGRRDEIATLLQEVRLPLDDDEVAGRLTIHHSTFRICPTMGSPKSPRLSCPISSRRSGSWPARRQRPGLIASEHVGNTCVARVVPS
jgi:hypothetical protein